MKPEFPRVCMNVKKLESNARVLTERCRERGIEVAGVVKCCCGSPEVARAFVRGGVRQIADSRVSNLRRLRRSGLTVPLWLLRLPMLSEVEEVVRVADVSLNASPVVLEALSHEAERQRKVHQVMLMVDLGDRREGVLPGNVPELASMIRQLPGLYLAGIGTNLTCFGGIVPDEENMGVLAETVRQVRRDFELAIPWVSAGNSSSLTWALSGKMPPEVNHLRLGESLLLGKETADGQRLPGTSPDAFTLEAEVIEASVKPSMPEGESHLDAFGQKPQIEDLGIRHRAILGIGREDVMPEGLTPLDSRIKILGASSDHLICDVEDAVPPVRVGQHLAFTLSYGALLSAMTSSYVGKLVEDVGVSSAPREVMSIGYTAVADRIANGTLGSPEALLGMSAQYKAKPWMCVNHPSELKEQVGECGRRGYVPVILAGDMTAVTSLEALPGRGVIVFSAFGDFHESKQACGCHSGCSLAALCGRSTDMFLPVSHPVPEANVVHVGMQRAEADEKVRLRDSELTLFTMEQVDLLGIREVMVRSLAHLEDMPELWLVLSMSVLASEEGAYAPQWLESGLSRRELYCALEMLADSGRVGGVLLCDCVNSPEAHRVAVELLATVFGKKII